MRVCSCVTSLLHAQAVVIICLLTPVQVWGTSNVSRCRSQRIPLASRCTGCPPRYKGKLCASTTRYNDKTKAACGCGKTDPIPPDWWTLTEYTAAQDAKNLDHLNPELAWCPHGCGGCYELCSTGGGSHHYQSTPSVCHVFKITNRCGDGYKQYPEWCSNEMSWRECEDDPARCQEQRSTNWYGYPAHFDLQDSHYQVTVGLGWDNAEVTFEPVSCSRWKGAAWDCQCSASTGQLEEEPYTVIPAAPEPQPAAAGGCGKAFEQCGGAYGWSGPVCCEDGCQCDHTQGDYSQCEPANKGAETCKESLLLGTAASITFSALGFFDSKGPSLRNGLMRLTPWRSETFLFWIPAVAALTLLFTAGLFWHCARQSGRGLQRSQNSVMPYVDLPQQSVASHVPASPFL